MAIKNYAEMRKVDVSSYVEKRDGNDYLNWARCKELLHQNGAEVVYFEPCVNANGSSLFMSDQVFTDNKGNTNRCYEIRVHIVIDDLEFDAQYPLMNGSNPVKDNSLSQQRVWNAQTRAFVKGVAMRTGLGFDLWLNNMEEVDTEEDLSKHSLFAIKERFQQEYTRVIKNKKMSTSEIAAACEMTEDEVKTVFTYFEQLNRFEQKLLKI
jgi:hypothetical protein